MTAAAALVPAAQAVPAPRMGESSLCLSGMHCAACSGIIERALLAVPGVTQAEVNAVSQRATVRWDATRTQAEAIIAAIRRAGYDAVPDHAVAARALRRAERRQALWRLFVASFCAMQVMMLAAPAYLAQPGEIAPDLLHLMNWGSWLMAVPVVLFSAGPFFSGAWAALRRRRIGMDVPVALGIGVTFVASSAALFDPTGPFGAEVYFDSLTMFISFLLLGRWFEMGIRHRAAQALEASLGALPELAERLNDDGSAERITVALLRVGDRVRVPVGQAFAADGVLIEGRTDADEALLTGESRPRSKGIGAEVVAGSVNLTAPVVMRVQRVGGDTRYEAIVALMREAAVARPALARSADRWAAPFLWAVLVLAAGAALVWSFIDPSRAVWVAVSVLIVTCPCALSLATPSALLSASQALSRRGLLLRRIDALESLAHIDRLFVDKTGTLTQDRPSLRSVALVDGHGAARERALLQAAAALAAWSRHPASVALCDAVPPAAGPAVVWNEVREQAGAGLEARDAHGVVWRLGNAGWAGWAASVGAAPEPTSQEDDAAALTVWFGPEGRPALRLAFDEAIRDDVREALALLRADGVAVTLLSGDTEARVAHFACRLHIDEAIGAADPATKLQAVARAQAAGEVVAMVGDGINDAPVLARADVSLAMGQGALIARANADAVIVSNRLSDVAHARRLARRTLGVIRQNMVWAAAYNAVCVPLALAGALPPWAAGLGMALSSLFVVANAARLQR